MIPRNYHHMHQRCRALWSFIYDSGFKKIDQNELLNTCNELIKTQDG